MTPVSPSALEPAAPAPGRAPAPAVDPSAFYRLNEEVARELARLDRAGALEGLRALLAESGAELWVASVRPRDGLEELVGVLRPGARPPEPPPIPAPPAHEEGADGAGCGAGCGGERRAAAEGAHAPGGSRGGWDHEGVLAVRSRFTVVLPDGTPREVYMPDHVCPACLGDDGNAIDACARVCGRCGFRW